MRLSLRYRLLVPPAVLLTGVAGATAWAAATAAAAAERRIAHQIQGVARTLAEPPTFPLKPRVLEQMKGLSGAEFLLVERTGERVTTFADPNIPPPDVPDVPLTADNPSLGPPVQVQGVEFRCLKVPLRDPHPDRGGVLYIFFPESLRLAAVRDAVRPTLLLGAGSGLAALFLAVATATRLVGRIRSLEQRTRDIAAGAFEPMALPQTDDEIRDLCASVNDMARRLADYRGSLAAAERLRVLGQVSGGLAHQLRNAATGAKLAVELHAHDCPAPDRESLDIALHQLARIEANLRQFLDLGRPPGTTRLEFDLVQAIDMAVEFARPHARHAGTTLTWHPPTVPATLTGDPNQLGHLFANLIGNALDAAGPGGTVDVCFSPSSHPGKDQSGSYTVEVSDTGPGPPPEIADKLFDPFITGKDQGIGLGLAVAKQAVDAHGGKLNWERRDGRTVFRVELPV